MVSSDVGAISSLPYVRTGEQYKQSLRDGRRVIYDGAEVEDVTTHPAFERSVSNLASFFDMQHDPETRDILTFTDENGDVRSTGWLVPRTHEDLVHRREALRLSTLHTAGVFGRPPDYGSTICMGYLSLLDRFEALDPSAPRKVREFVAAASAENAVCADVLAEPQADRRIPTAQKPGRLRVVKETSEGVYLYGAKAVGSVGLIGNYMTVANLVATDMDPASQVWCQIPMSLPGLTLVSREALTLPGSLEDHPVDAYGDEPDAFYIFDNVFLPWQNVLSYRTPELMGLYYPVCALAHWHILARLWYRAEIFAGLAKAIVDALGGEGIPANRNAVAGVYAYAQSLKSFVLAAEAQAKPTKTGVLIPDIATITAGRLYSTENYPSIMQTIRDLSSQGLVSRFSRRTWDYDGIGEKLEEFLVGAGMSARDKNSIFNLAWDVACGSHATRVALFENLNATAPAVVREQIYRSYDSKSMVAYVWKVAKGGLS